MVQFYDGNVRNLTPGVCHYLSEGLHAGEGCIVIATTPHWQAFIAELKANDVNPEDALHDGRLAFRAAEETLARLMGVGEPNWERFKSTIEPLLESVKARALNGRVRAYGEMVSVLWNAGQSSAAIRLEELWNKLIAAHSFSLYCAYQIDVFGKEFHGSVLDSVLCTHTHLLPSGSNLDGAVDRAMSDVLGTRAEGMKDLMKHNFRPSWASIPKPEAKVLWIRNNLPGHADEILARARGYFAEF